jgi:chromosome segregation ATPase
MARPSKFTDEAILAAATALKEAGQDVSGYALAKVLEGGRPSSLEDRYKELVAAQAVVVPLPALPASIEVAISELVAESQKRLTAVLTHTHAGLQKAADDRVGQVESDAAAEVAKAKAELDEAVELLGVEKDRAVAAEEKLQAATETIAQLRTELAEAKGELAATRTAHDKLASTVVAKLDSMTSPATKA